MNQYFLLLILLISTSTKAQVLEKGSFYISGSIGKYKPNTFQELNITPLMYEFRTGYTVIKNLSIGLNYQSTLYKENYEVVSGLQQPGSEFTDKGIHQVKYDLLGLNLDYNIKISNRLYMYPSAYIDKINFKDEMAGEYYNNNQPTGITHVLSRYPNYKMALGMNLNFKYYFSSNCSIIVRLLEYQYRTRNVYAESLLAAPILLGLNYHFKPNFK
jgi:Outer membrane protein beta-barrel domain